MYIKKLNDQIKLNAPIKQNSDGSIQ